MLIEEAQATLCHDFIWESNGRFYPYIQCYFNDNPKEHKLSLHVNPEEVMILNATPKPHNTECVSYQI